jgi:hypothetical protein
MEGFERNPGELEEEFRRIEWGTTNWRELSSRQHLRTTWHSVGNRLSNAIRSMGLPDEALARVEEIDEEIDEVLGRGVW